MRLIMEVLTPRIFTPPEESFFLFGPRGTGKSTWLRTRYSDALQIDLLDPEVFRTYSAHPERLTEVVSGNPGKKQIILDEVQKVPDLLDVVHALIEEKRGIQFILTGSSSRKLKRTGVDLLAGRALTCSLFPFIASELKESFDLSTALTSGMVPLITRAKDPEKALKAYVSLYVTEEVRSEGFVRNIGSFSRFLEAISFSHGSVLNVSNVARECQVERKVVENYISILEDMLLSYRLPVFSKRAKRAMASHPKFYFFDAGVFRSFRPTGPLDRPEEIAGTALEGLVAQHLIAWNSYRGSKNALSYWRTRSGNEVDFVLYGKEVFWAIEVKNSTRVEESDLQSLRSFKADYPECETFLLYRGKDRLLKQGVPCIPCEQFLLELDPKK